LELLSRLFAARGEAEITQWTRREPAGRNARRAAWLYEWLTGNLLDAPASINAPYVPILEPDRYWVAPDLRSKGERKRMTVRVTESEKAALQAFLDGLRGNTHVRRWRVRDNMPGTRAFCPMVVLDDDVKQSLSQVDIRAALAALEHDFGIDLLRRSAVWLTLKESRSSFTIEGEHNPDREQRFASAMEVNLGKMSNIFGDDLLKLQREILGSRALHHGLRQSPIFVGQVVQFREVVHYVAPPYEMLSEMLRALQMVLSRTEGSNPLVRAAAISFAFVYLHPLTDGNGRVSRFLINDVLRRDGAVEAPLVLPVSANITKDMTAYDRVLDRFSAPFRARYARSWRFVSKDTRYPDGQISNFDFDEYEDAGHAWKYLDLTDHVKYMVGVVSDTIRGEMRDEAIFLRNHLQLRKRLGNLIEGSDQALDRIIRSVGENRRITGVLEAEYPILQDADLAGRVVEAVLESVDAVTTQ